MDFLIKYIGDGKMACQNNRNQNNTDQRNYSTQYVDQYGNKIADKDEVILSKDKYAPKTNNINICEFPDIDFNSIKQPPTSINNKTYYGLYQFYIKYAYKYNITVSDSCIFTFSRLVYVDKKL